MTIRNATKVPTNKAERLYIMVDEKPGFALVKDGMSRDNLKNRFNQYRSSNPMLLLVATCEIRKNQNLEKVEKMFYDFLKAKGFEQLHGEWIKVTDPEVVEGIKRDGFKYFDNLFYRTKNNTYYNKMVCDLWASRKK